MTSEHLLTHHKQMSSFALGHLQLRTPDKIDDSLSAARQGKSDATGRTGDGTGECFLGLVSFVPVKRTVGASPARADVDVVDFAGHQA